MRGLAIASILLVAACFDPTPPAGALCSEEGACPAGQRCDSSGRCVSESSPDIDAAIDAPSDAMVDAEPDAAIDAMIDAPAGPRTVTFQSATSSSSESGTVAVMVTLSGPAPMNLTVTVSATGGSANRPADYTTPNSTSVMFPTGSTQQSVPVTIVNDNIDEDDETAILTLGAGTGTTLGAITTHTLTIADNDDPPTVQWDPMETNTTAPEGVANAMTPFMWRVVLSAPSSRMITVPVTFSGTAANPSDYTVMSGDVPVVFPAGTTSKVVRVTVLGDPTVGPDETIIMTLGAPTNASLGAGTVRTHTLLNDD